MWCFIAIFALVLCPGIEALGGASEGTPSFSSMFVKFDECDFDGCCFEGRPKFNVVGDVEQAEGVRGQALYLNQRGDNHLPAKCIVAQGLPDVCPYNVKRCTEGATFSFWLNFGADENGDFFTDNCNNAFMMGGKGILFNRFGFEYYINYHLNDYLAFCPISDIKQNLEGKWTHFAFTVRGSGDAPRVFINGTEHDVSLFPDDGGCFAFNAPVPYQPDITIGCRPDADTPDTECGFRGLIDDFRVIPKELQPADITILAHVPEGSRP